MVPLSLTIVVAHLMALRSYGDVFSDRPANALSALGGMFGFPQLYWGKLVLVAVLFLFYERMRQKAWKDFWTIWIATSLVGMTVLILTFSPQNLYPRYFLAFYLPLWLWLTDSVRFVREQYFRIATSAFIVAVGVMPVIYQREYFADYGEWAREATDFVKKSLTLVPPGEGRCYYAWGSPVEASIARRFYLPRRRPDEKCTEKYYLYFTGLPCHIERKIYADRDPAAENVSEFSSLSPLFHDKRGRILSRKSTEGILKNHSVD